MYFLDWFHGSTIPSQIIPKPLCYPNKSFPGPKYFPQTEFLSCKNKSTQRAQTSLAKVAHYPPIAWIPDLKGQYRDPHHPNNLINSSLHNCGAILKISSQSVHNFLRNGRISNWAVSMVIGSPPKFNPLFLLPPRTPP